MESRRVCYTHTHSLYRTYMTTLICHRWYGLSFAIDGTDFHRIALKCRPVLTSGLHNRERNERPGHIYTQAFMPPRIDDVISTSRVPRHSCTAILVPGVFCSRATACWWFRILSKSPNIISSRYFILNGKALHITCSM